jgi:hypothetical protein
MEAKTKKIFIVSSVIGVFAIGAAAIALTGKRKKLQTLIKQGSPDVLAPASQTTSSSVFPLTYASGDTIAETNDIKVVQRYLNAKNINLSLLQIPLSEDGIFGPKTRSTLLNIEGVSEVSSDLFQSMVNYLASQDTSTADPSVLKNDLTQ